MFLAVGSMAVGAVFWRGGIWLQENWAGFFDERPHPFLSGVEQFSYAMCIMFGVCCVIGGALTLIAPVFCQLCR